MSLKPRFVLRDRDRDREREDHSCTGIPKPLCVIGGGSTTPSHIPTGAVKGFLADCHGGLGWGSSPPPKPGWGEGATRPQCASRASPGGAGPALVASPTRSGRR